MSLDHEVLTRLLHTDLVFLILYLSRGRFIELIRADLQGATTFTSAEGGLYLLATILVWVELIVLFREL